MKIFTIDGNYGAESNIGATDCRPVICQVADSSIILGSKPLFLPDFDSDFKMHPSLAVRICRLGKSIAPRFAHRYYDEMAIALNVRAESLLASLRQQGLPWTPAVSFDGATPIGEFRHTDAPLPADTAFTISLSDGTSRRWVLNKVINSLDSVIAFISNYFCIKTGDILLFALDDDGIPVHPEMRVEGTFDGDDHPSMAFNIK